MYCPDYRVIGHIKDLLDGGFTVGGTVTYSGLTARNLGRRVGVVTSASPGLDLKKALLGIEVVSAASFSVEQPGVASIPSRQQVEACLSTSYPMGV